MWTYILGDMKPVGKVVVASSCHAYATDLCVNIYRITDNYNNNSLSQTQN